VDTLRSVSCIAAEDTRHTRKLLTHFDIRAELIRYDDHVHAQVAPKIIARLRAGQSVAQVTDAGMPGISDPGIALANAVRAADLPIQIIPGPDAVSTALLASGLPTVPYTFHGFAPRKKGERARTLGDLSPGTHVFYEAPTRVSSLLEHIADVLPCAQVAVCRELTKKFESVARGTAGEVLRAADAGERGEIVVVLYVPPQMPSQVDDRVLEIALRALIEDGVSRSDASKRIAAEYGVPKRHVYALAQTL